MKKVAACILYFFCCSSFSQDCPSLAGQSDSSLLSKVKQISQMNSKQEACFDYLLFEMNIHTDLTESQSEYPQPVCKENNEFPSDSNELFSCVEDMEKNDFDSSTADITASFQDEVKVTEMMKIPKMPPAKPSAKLYSSKIVNYLNILHSLMENTASDQPYSPSYSHLFKQKDADKSFFFLSSTHLYPVEVINTGVQNPGLYPTENTYNKSLSYLEYIFDNRSFVSRERGYEAQLRIEDRPPTHKKTSQTKTVILKFPQTALCTEKPESAQLLDYLQSEKSNAIEDFNHSPLLFDIMHWQNISDLSLSNSAPDSFLKIVDFLESDLFSKKYKDLSSEERKQLNSFEKKIHWLSFLQKFIAGYFECEPYTFQEIVTLSKTMELPLEGLSIEDNGSRQGKPITLPLSAQNSLDIRYELLQIPIHLDSEVELKKFSFSTAHIPMDDQNELFELYEQHLSQLARKIFSEEYEALQ